GPWFARLPVPPDAAADRLVGVVEGVGRADRADRCAPWDLTGLYAEGQRRRAQEHRLTSSAWRPTTTWRNISDASASGPDSSTTLPRPWCATPHARSKSWATAHCGPGRQSVARV